MAPNILFILTNVLTYSYISILILIWNVSPLSSVYNVYNPSPRAQRTIFFYLIFHSFCFCVACEDKSGDFSPFLSIVYVHPPPTWRLRLVYRSTLKILCIVIVSLTCLAYFLSLDYLSYINSLAFLFIFCFSLTKGQRSKRYTIRIGNTPTCYISICISTLPTRRWTSLYRKLS